MPKPTKKQIEAMEKLGFSKEEIEDIIKTDEAKLLRTDSCVNRYHLTDVLQERKEEKYWYHISWFCHSDDRYGSDERGSKTVKRCAGVHEHFTYVF